MLPVIQILLKTTCRTLHAAGCVFAYAYHVKQLSKVIHLVNSEPSPPSTAASPGLSAIFLSYQHDQGVPNPTISVTQLLWHCLETVFTVPRK